MNVAIVCSSSTAYMGDMSWLRGRAIECASHPPCPGSTTRGINGLIFVYAVRCGNTLDLVMHDHISATQAAEANGDHALLSLNAFDSTAALTAILDGMPP